MAFQLLQSRESLFARTSRNAVDHKYQCAERRSRPIHGGRDYRVLENDLRNVLHCRREKHVSHA